MNIKEIMKKATPRPLIAHKGEIYKCDNVTAPFTHVGFCGDDGTPHYKEMSDNEQDTNQQLGEVNAALLVHWYNVGPKLLAVLERLSRSINEMSPQEFESWSHECAGCKSPDGWSEHYDVIDEASEVKI